MAAIRRGVTWAAARLTILSPVLLAVSLVGLAPRPALAEEPVLLVSAASSLSDAFREIKALYLLKRPEVEIALNLGGSGLLRTQIERGAPVDLFAAAGWGPVKNLIDKGWIARQDVRIFARNRLVVIVPSRSADRTGDESPVDAAEQSPWALRDLLRSEVKRIAVGNVATVPAGTYAAEVLERAGLAASLSDKLIPAENVRQVLEYVASGAADVGFVYATDLLPGVPVRSVMTVPDSLHTPILYPIAPVTGGPSPDEARRFIAFVTGPEGQRVLARYGFLPPGEGEAP